MKFDPGTAVAISYSGGTSSEWLVRAALSGVLPRPEQLAVFFADTGIEHIWTYDAVERVETLCKTEGVTFVRCARDETLPAHLLAIHGEGRTRADHPPLWIAKGSGRGQAEHRCTREFKVAPMRRAQTEWLKSIGQPKRVTKWIGFGADEWPRAIKSEGKQDVQWERLDFPAVRLGVKRGQQRADVERWAGSAPRFSMCTICPWKSPKRWRETPEQQLRQVYEIDEAIRDASPIGLTDGDAYLCDRLVSVEQLIRKGDPQPMLPGIDMGCDAGGCFL